MNGKEEIIGNQNRLLQNVFKISLCDSLDADNCSSNQFQSKLCVWLFNALPLIVSSFVEFTISIFTFECWHVVNRNAFVQ